MNRGVLEFHERLEAVTEPGRLNTAEALKRSLPGFEQDFKRGIVRIDPAQNFAQYSIQLGADPTAGIRFDYVRARLNDRPEAAMAVAAMQGGGQLIGIMPSGQLCFKDRANTPVLTLVGDHGYLHTITTDTADRKEILRQAFVHDRHANYWQIRSSTRQAGYYLPPDQGHESRGIVPAIEAVTGLPYVGPVVGQGDKACGAAILDCGEASPRDYVRAFSFNAARRLCHLVTQVNPNSRDTYRGAVRLYLV